MITTTKPNACPTLTATQRRILVVRAVDPYSATLARCPNRMDDRDRFFQCNDRLARRQPSSAHPFDRISESAGPDAQLEAAAAQEIQTGGTTASTAGCRNGRLSTLPLTWMCVVRDATYASSVHVS
jgi:hypothetical protein